MVDVLSGAAAHRAGFFTSQPSPLTIKRNDQCTIDTPAGDRSEGPVGPHGTPWDHLGPLGITWDHLGPLGTTGNFGELSDVCLVLGENQVIGAKFSTWGKV